MSSNLNSFVIPKKPPKKTAQSRRLWADKIGELQRHHAQSWIAHEMKYATLGVGGEYENS